MVRGFVILVLKVEDHDELVVDIRVLVLVGRRLLKACANAHRLQRLSNTLSLIGVGGLESLKAQQSGLELTEVRARSGHDHL